MNTKNNINDNQIFEINKQNYKSNNNDNSIKIEDNVKSKLYFHIIIRFKYN